MAEDNGKSRTETEILAIFSRGNYTRKYPGPSSSYSGRNWTKTGDWVPVPPLVLVGILFKTLFSTKMESLKHGNICVPIHFYTKINIIH